MVCDEGVGTAAREALRAGSMAAARAVSSLYTSCEYTLPPHALTRRLWCSGSLTARWFVALCLRSPQLLLPTPTWLLVGGQR